MNIDLEICGLIFISFAVLVRITAGPAKCDYICCTFSFSGDVCILRLSYLGTANE